MAIGFMAFTVYAPIIVSPAPPAPPTKHHCFKKALYRSSDEDGGLGGFFPTRGAGIGVGDGAAGGGDGERTGNASGFGVSGGDGDRDFGVRSGSMASELSIEKGTGRLAGSTYTGTSSNALIRSSIGESNGELLPLDRAGVTSPSPSECTGELEPVCGL